MDGVFCHAVVFSLLFYPWYGWCVLSRCSVYFTVLPHGMDGVFCHAVVVSLLFYPMVWMVFCHAVVFSSLFYPMVWMVGFVTL